MKDGRTRLLDNSGIERTVSDNRSKELSVAIIVQALSEAPDMPSHRKSRPIAAYSLCTVRFLRVGALVRGASALHASTHTRFPPT